MVPRAIILLFLRMLIPIKLLISLRILVAGVEFEPTTFRLWVQCAKFWKIFVLLKHANARKPMSASTFINLSTWTVTNKFS